MILSFGCFLIACLAVATSMDGYFKTSHEIARAGQTTLVICGQNGVSEVTLDESGAPVPPVGRVCDHCVDCSLISGVDVPGVDASLGKTVWARSTVQPVTQAIVMVSRQTLKMPRAPPSKAIS